jgi:putative PIN family toxin of toxin-antitoxin system
MRVVADTNVVISGLIFGGKPDAFLRLASSGTLILIYSSETVEELRRILRERFEWPIEQVDIVTGNILKSAEIVRPSARVADCSDADDNRILEAAFEGHADWIVSGDKHLLRMRSFRGIGILTVSDFLLRIEL